ALFSHNNRKPNMDIEREQALVELRKSRGAKKIDGKAIDKDNAAIAALEAEMAAEKDAAAERVRREPVAAAEAHQSQVNSIRAELADLSAASTRALTEAESKLREAVAAQRLHHTHEAAKRKAIGRLNQLTGSKESALSEFELHRQNSRLWLAQLNTLTSAPG